MLIIKGVNVFPSQIEGVLIRLGLTSNYQIIVDRLGTTDSIEVLVEMTPELFGDTVTHISRIEEEMCIRDSLSTIQIAITLSGFLGSAFAADNFASRLVNWLVSLLSLIHI